jgi:hypothetical protein
MCVGDKVTSFSRCLTCEKEQIVAFLGKKYFLPTAATETLVTLSPCHPRRAFDA